MDTGIRYRLCIFDLDGTLTDTIGGIAYFANSALNRFGYGSIETEAYKVLVGDGARALIERALRSVGAPVADAGAVLKFYNKIYNENFLYKTTVYDGIPELLAQLKQNGVKTAVLSNKPHETTVKVLEALFPRGAFDIYFGAREGVPLKPDKTAVLEIIGKLGARHGECLYVGDTATDVQTGKGAGLFTAGALWGFRTRAELEQAGADVIAEKPSDILALIPL